MDYVIDHCMWLMGYTEHDIKPSLFFIYALAALLVTFLVNWALAAIFVVLKPLTLAAILVLFIRPDLAHTVLEDGCLGELFDRSKIAFFQLARYLLLFGERFREKFS